MQLKIHEGIDEATSKYSGLFPKFLAFRILFQVAHCLCDQADMIFVEDFGEDIDFQVSAQGFLGKYMPNGGLGQFRDWRSWVCWKRNRDFAKLDSKYSSQICPNCGTHTGKKLLSQSVYSGSECGHQKTGDLTAAKVLLQRGLDFISGLKGHMRQAPASPRGKEIPCQVALSKVLCPEQWRGAGKLNRARTAVRSTVEKPIPLDE